MASTVGAHPYRYADPAEKRSLFSLFASSLPFIGIFISAHKVAQLKNDLLWSRSLDDKISLTKLINEYRIANIVRCVLMISTSINPLYLNIARNIFPIFQLISIIIHIILIASEVLQIQKENLEIQSLKYQEHLATGL